MEQVNNNAALAMLQAMAAQPQTAQTDKSDGGSDFQKLMEKAQSQSQPQAQSEQADGKVEQQPAKTGKPAAAKKENPAQKKQGEDPVGEAAGQLQVYLVPLTPEELSQYPASWLPNVEEGEPIVCVGVTTDVNGQQMPILMGADAAQQRYGREVIAPETVELPQGGIEIPEEMLQVQVPEKLEQAVMEAPVMEEAPTAREELPEVEIKPVMEEAPKAQTRPQAQAQPQPQAHSQEEDEDGDVKVEVTDAEQAPQRLFHDVKAAPVKVGEVYDTEQAEDPDVARQIDTGLAQALDKGDSMVRIQLNPENLGSVTVEISRSAEGIIHVALNARSGETRGLLERHAGELQGMLASRTQQGVEVEVQRQQESQQGQNQQRQQQNYDGRNGHAQDGQQQRRQRHEQTSSQDFIQQLRLGLIPLDGDGA